MRRPTGGLRLAIACSTAVTLMMIVCVYEPSITSPSETTLLLCPNRGRKFSMTAECLCWTLTLCTLKLTGVLPQVYRSIRQWQQAEIVRRNRRHLVTTIVERESDARIR